MSLSDKAEETGKQKPDGESDESAQIYRFLGPKFPVSGDKNVSLPP